MTSDYKKVFLTALAAGCLAYCPLSAQSERILTIEEMFSLADANSKSIKVHSLAVDEAEEAVRAAENERLPSIEAGLSMSYIGNGWMCDRDFTNGTVAEMPHFGNNFAFKATQAVYAGGAVTEGIRISRLRKEMASTELENDRQNIRMMLVGHYLDLYQLNNQKKVYQENIRQTELLIEEIRSSYEQGTALKSDITRYELQLKNLELGLTSVTDRIRIISRLLAVTVGLDADTRIIPDSTLSAINTDRKTEQYWQSERSGSPVAKLAELSVKMSERHQALTRAGMLPSVGIIAANNFDGPILIEVPPINKNFNYWYVGIGITYRFDALYKNNRKLRQAKAATLRAREYSRLVDEQISNDINAAYINLEEAYIRLESKEKSVQLANENYDIVRNRYLNGLSLITDMLDAANIRLSNELELENARANILYQYFLLKKTTGTL